MSTINYTNVLSSVTRPGPARNLRDIIRARVKADKPDVAHI